MKFSSLWYVNPKTRQLQSPYVKDSASFLIAPGSAMTVSLTSVMIAKDFDGFLRGDNDLLILSRSSLGEAPQVERIHFFQNEVPKRKVLRNFFADNLLLTEDYANERLWLEIQIMEIDQDLGDRQAAVELFQNLGATAGAVFPALLPYTFAASAAINLANKLVSALEKNKTILSLPLALYSHTQTRPGQAILQTGQYVGFTSDNIQGESYQLELDGSVKLHNGSTNQEISYVVFDINNQAQPSPKFIENQRIATLLTQIHSGNSNTVRGTLEFLSDTLKKYSNFKKLERYLELSKKSPRSPEEEAQLKAIAALPELADFLPKKP